jgi:hypothetical protein
MASLPDKYDARVRKALGVRAVWTPGEPRNLGDILVKRGSQFFPFDDLSSFGATFNRAAHTDKSLDLASSHTKQRIFQAGVELPDASKLDLSAEASVKLEFNAKDEFILKTPTLSGEHITNMNKVAQAVFGRPDWKHDKYYIIEEIYQAEEWTFLGTESSSSKIDVSGKGAGILSFLTAGASAQINVTGSIDLKFIGKGGALAMGLVRVKKDGSLNHG